jgi:DNA repair photolyase
VICLELATGKRATEYFDDDSQSVISENNSPDLPFRYSLNPYRGCAHGCSYCYARPTHEYLGFSAGLDFETKIIVKRKAPELLQRFLARPVWRAQPIMLSGVTDCYQPGESQFQVTRGCLQVALDFQQPIMLITKNSLILRDADLIASLARRLVSVAISITSRSGRRANWSPNSSPRRGCRRLRVTPASSAAMLAPIILGLNDRRSRFSSLRRCRSDLWQ